MFGSLAALFAVIFLKFSTTFWKSGAICFWEQLPASVGGGGPPRFLLHEYKYDYLPPFRSEPRAPRKLETFLCKSTARGLILLGVVEKNGEPRSRGVKWPIRGEGGETYPAPTFNPVALLKKNASWQFFTGTIPSHSFKFPGIG